MGATVTTGKLACAYKCAAGNTIYILFEETYEKNCYPHTPRWSCVYYGYLEGALEAIFKISSCAEGGILQTRKGHTKPETYLQGWLKEMAFPAVFNGNQSVTLKIGKGYDMQIPEDQTGDFYKVLHQFGHSGIVELFRQHGSVTLSLMHDAAVFAAAFGNGSCLGPGRFMRASSTYLHFPRSEALGYRPKTKKTLIAVPSFLRLPDNECVLVKQEDGTWKCEGWAYSIVGSFIASLWREEHKNPGAWTNIVNFRKAITDAPIAQPGTIVRVNSRDPELATYHIRLLDELKATGALKQVGTDYVMELPTARDLLWKLTSLPSSATSWITPGPCVSTGPLEQLSLLTA